MIRLRRRIVRGLSAGVLSAWCVVTPGLGGSGDAAAATPPRITMAFTGDIIGSPATWPAARRNAGGHGFDYRPMFARLRPLISSADLAICHLETPLSGPGVSISGAPRFAAPHQVAGAIRYAGYDGCSTASNHALDQGRAGIRTTLDALDAAGLEHAGTARMRSESRRITTYSVGDVTIAHLSYAFGFNGLHPKHPWEANLIDPERIVARARRARREGADLVVVSMHWGIELRHAPTTWQLDVARRLAKSRAIDLIVGHHVHVVQPIRRVQSQWVVYGVGNSLTGMLARDYVPDVQDGMVVLVTFESDTDGWNVTRVRFAPTWVQPGLFVVRLVGPAIEAGNLPAPILAELRRSWRRTISTVDAATLGVKPFRRTRLPSG